MILSKASLSVHKAAATKSGRRSLQNVKIEKDGSVVASDGELAVAIEPSNPDSVTMPIAQSAMVVLGDKGLVVPAPLLNKAAKNLSADKRLSLQHVAITRTADPGKIGFTMLDSTGSLSVVEGSPVPTDYPDWKKWFRRGSDEDRVKVCVNRRVLIDMLKVVDEASQATSNVFIEIDKRRGVILARSINRTTGQRVIGACVAIDTQNQWLEPNAWEAQVFGSEQAPKPRVKFVRKVPQ